MVFDRNIRYYRAYRQNRRGQATDKIVGYALVLVSLVLSFWLVFGISQNGCAAVRSLQSGGNFGNALKSDLFGSPHEEYRESVIKLPVRDGYAPNTRKLAYETLNSDRLREAYRSVEKSAFRVTEVPAITLTDEGNDKNNEAADEEYGYKLAKAYIPRLSSAEIFMVIKAVANDHPEIFWITNSYVVGSNMHDGLYVVLHSSYSYDEIDAMKQELEQRVGDIMESIPSGLSHYQIEVLIHDMLVTEVDYDHSAALRTDLFSDASTSYGALVNKKAMCGGKSLAAKLLLNRLGVLADVIVGEASDKDSESGNKEEPVNHMWNIVQIEGQWYHLDITWDDPTTEEELKKIRENNLPKMGITHNYFNITDGMIGLTHTIAPGYEKLTEEYFKDESRQILFNFPMPACNSKRYNYYEREAIKIPDLGAMKSDTLESFLEAGRNGKKIIYLLFSDDYNVEQTDEWVKWNIRKGIDYIGDHSDIKVDLAESNAIHRYHSKLWPKLYRVRMEYR